MTSFPTSDNLCILLAEDDEDDKEFITLAFQNVASKHKVHITSNGQEVLDFLFNLSSEKDLPRLIVLDLNMPVLDGLQTLEILNERPLFQNIPKIIFTTSDSDEDRNRCLAKGAAGFIVKPTNMPEFTKSVEYMLGYCS